MKTNQKPFYRTGIVTLDNIHISDYAVINGTKLDKHTITVIFSKYDNVTYDEFTKASEECINDGINNGDINGKYPGCFYVNLKNCYDIVTVGADNKPCNSDIFKNGCKAIVAFVPYQYNFHGRVGYGYNVKAVKYIDEGTPIEHNVVDYFE